MLVTKPCTIAVNNQILVSKFRAAKEKKRNMVNSRILTVHREKKYFSSQKKKRKRKKKLYMRLYSFGEY